jgi:phage antirepressor YoqD-like protein
MSANQDLLKVKDVARVLDMKPKALYYHLREEGLK